MFAAAVLSSCGPPVPATAPAPVSDAPAQPGPVAVGQDAPPFTLERIDGGGRVSLPTRKVTLLAFFALEWGGHRALAKLETIHQRYASQGLAVLAISHDESRQSLPEVPSRYGTSFPIAWDEARRVLHRWRPSRPMAVYLIDRRGVVRFIRVTGKESSPADDPSVEEAIEDVLATSR